MELKNNGNINFILDLFANFKDQISGGLYAFHKLAYLLAKEGHNVYIFCEPEFPHENIIVVPAEIKINGSVFHGYWETLYFPLDNTVSIYAEHNLNNPFGTKHITRWVLYHSSKYYEDQWGENEYIFNYGNYKTHKNKFDGVLNCKEYNLDKLYITTSLSERQGYCHILHKDTPEDTSILNETFNSNDLTNWKDKGNLDFLREEFNKYEYFLTYDKNSYFTTMATLCGCKAIILEPNMMPIEHRLNNPENMFGVAYGLDDLEWAEKTLPFARDYVMDLEKASENTVKNFINFWKEKCFLK